VQEIETNKRFVQDQRIQVQQSDFFELDLSLLIDQSSQNLLVLGNFPWVTNAQQQGGFIQGNEKPDEVDLPKLASLGEPFAILVCALR
jgi:hypothetical protein